ALRGCGRGRHGAGAGCAPRRDRPLAALAARGARRAPGRRPGGDDARRGRGHEPGGAPRAPGGGRDAAGAVRRDGARAAPRDPVRPGLRDRAPVRPTPDREEALAPPRRSGARLWLTRPAWIRPPWAPPADARAVARPCGGTFVLFELGG